MRYMNKNTANNLSAQPATVGIQSKALKIAAVSKGIINIKRIAVNMNSADSNSMVLYHRHYLHE